ncbi:MAG: prepilin-type N-terminal cleavage/methylation domain-containing protein [Armatimonadetes bacterium]|nr:prepilin-type N-terminal cleavage/methylation domain-containing protein [Armatimonadota bacterium]NIM23519.1 prepilin-type N-terminal cleavage/methylation domain-containing protein [Armatimonadota bacterium]NIM67385.1 prepilin-type N-terminal cleavage/methylation domain-containing protein [Armatimonadota bacterium]NIM75886.1 prepilin-type N-terminal cleavage/methylation domain-containing protein [Armatimonadota bacterium]NIN05571.1 prepilin-type N-terminal cleavage/methylation domain-contain
MKHLRKQGGFTLIELLVVILILAVLMAIALPLYLRAVRDSQRQTCRSNMQTIANAEQAYKVRSPGHVYTTDLTLLVGPDQDLQALPRCPTDSGLSTTDDYTVTENLDGSITIRCNSDSATDAVDHNTVGADTNHGFTPGVDSE